jgi:chromosome segregation ATPase
MEKQRGKKKYEMQRKFLQKTSLLIASSLSGVNHGCSVALEHDEEEINKSKEMIDEIKVLNRQLKDAHGDLSRASDELEMLLKEKSVIEIEKNYLQTSFQELQDEHRQSRNYIFNLEMKVEEFRQQNLELVKEKENFELLIVNLQKSNTNKDLSIQSLNSNINELNSKFTNEVSAMQNNFEEDKKNMENSHKLLLSEKINIIESLNSLINTNREELKVERAVNVELKEKIDSLVSELSKEKSTLESMIKKNFILKDNLYIMKGPLQESLDILDNY